MGARDFVCLSMYIILCPKWNSNNVRKKLVKEVLKGMVGLEHFKYYVSENQEFLDTRVVFNLGER